MKLEQKLAELEKLSETVESADSTLEESMSAFEKSIDIAEQCFKELNSYKGKLTILEKRITELTEENEN